METNKTKVMLNTIEIEYDEVIYDVEFTYEDGSYGNGYDEAPVAPEVFIQSIINIETGEHEDDYFIETLAEEEAYQFITNQ